MQTLTMWSCKQILLNQCKIAHENVKRSLYFNSRARGNPTLKYKGNIHNLIQNILKLNFLSIIYVTASH